MFKWLTKRLKKKPSRELTYYWKDRKQGRVVLTGWVTGSIGMHLVVDSLGKTNTGHHLVSKGLATDQKHWQELWSEINEGKTISWEEPPDSGVGKSQRVEGRPGAEA